MSIRSARRREAVLLLAASAAVVLAASAAVGCDKLKESFEGGFGESFRREFAESCTQSAVDAGGKAAEMERLCECMGKDLTDHHSSAELTTISLAPNEPANMKLLNASRERCQAPGSAVPAASK